MKELLEYREKLIARLLEATKEFCEACKKIENPFEALNGGWSAHQIASHTRDVERLIYGERVQKTLHEENPLFKSFDTDAWTAQHYDKDEPLSDILFEFEASVQKLCALLKTMKTEDWSRLSRHESRGNELTLQLWVEHSLAHIEEHLREIKTSVQDR